MLFNEPKLLKSAAATARTATFPRVSVLFNEPKLLKFRSARALRVGAGGFSALQRAEIAEINQNPHQNRLTNEVSVLFNEPKLLKSLVHAAETRGVE